MPRHGFTTSALFFGPAFVAVLGLLSGCGSTKEFDVPADRQGIQEFAALYRDFIQKNKRSPKDLGELQRKAKSQAYPNALAMLKSGDLVVKWGSPPSPEGEGSSAVLAYEKNVATDGGNVLMQDGRTILKMTADEFAAASK